MHDARGFAVRGGTVRCGNCGGNLWFEPAVSGAHPGDSGADYGGRYHCSQCWWECWLPPRRDPGIEAERRAAVFTAEERRLHRGRPTNAERAARSGQAAP
jgi:hypothetical protein